MLLALARSIYLASGGSTRLGLTCRHRRAAGAQRRRAGDPDDRDGRHAARPRRAPSPANGDVRRQDLATLYGVNTLGAVAGCVLSTFFLLELYGTRPTLWLAAALNILVAIAARAIERRAVDRRDADDAAALERGARERAAMQALPEIDPPVSAALAGPLPFLLLASAAVGFAFFLMELVWYRMLGPLLGGSVFTFGLVLAVALAGIGLGGLLYSMVADDRPASLTGLATSCLLEALAIAATYALGDRMALLALAFVPLSATGFGGAITGWTIVAAIVVLPPAIVAGYQFPLLIALFGAAAKASAATSAWRMRANTAGAIVGSLAGGFGAAAVAVGARRVAARRRAAGRPRPRGGGSLSMRRERRARFGPAAGARGRAPSR